MNKFFVTTLLFLFACDPVGTDMTTGDPTATTGSPGNTTTPASTTTTTTNAGGDASSGAADDSSGGSTLEFPEHECPGLFDPDLTCAYTHRFRRRGQQLNTPNGPIDLVFPMVSQAYDQFDDPVDLSCALSNGKPVDLREVKFDIGTIPTNVMAYPGFPSLQTNAESIQALYGCDPIDSNVNSLTWQAVYPRLAKVAENTCIHYLEEEFGCPRNEGDSGLTDPSIVWADEVCVHYLAIPYTQIMQEMTQPLRWHDVEGTTAVDSADINSGAVVIDTLMGVLECSEPE